MWTRIIACVSLLLVSVSVSAVSDLIKPQDPSGDERAIRALEEHVAAASGRNDGEALSTLWAPEYLFVNPAGERLSAAQRLEMFRSGNVHYDGYAVDQQTIRIYGTTAVVFYRSTLQGSGGGMTFSSPRRVTNVLVKRDGRWQIVSQQSSRLRLQHGDSLATFTIAPLQPTQAQPSVCCRRSVPAVRGRWRRSATPIRRSRVFASS